MLHDGRHEFEFNTHRRCLRVPCKRPILYRVIDDGNGTDGLSTTSNVSLYGCRFVVSEPISVESLLALRLSIPYGVVSADALVVFLSKNRIRGYTVGVQFIRMLPGDRFLLESAIPGLNGSEIDFTQPYFRQHLLE